MKKMHYAVLTIFVVVLVALATPQVFGLLSSTLSLSSTGNIKTVNVKAYSDSSCANVLSSFSWGTIDVGGSASKQIWLRNEGNAPVTVSMTVQNWNPSSASSYITIGWNYAGQTISAGQVLALTLTCTVSSSASGVTSFSVDMVITGSG